MTIYIETEEEALQELDTALQEIEELAVSEAIRRACRVDISDLINEVTL